MTRERPLRVVVLAVTFLLALTAGRAFARLDLDRYSRLREAERYQMDIAEKLYQSRKWQSAQTEYEKFMKLYKDSKSVPYCQFMIAQCFQQKNLLNTAIKEYTKVTDFWSRSEDAPVAQYKIAECHWKMGDREKAVAAYDRLIDAFPKSPLCIGALYYEAEYYFRIKKNELGIEKLEKLMADYPRARGWEGYWDKGWERVYTHYCEDLSPDMALDMAMKRHSKNWAPLDCAYRFRQVGRKYAQNKDTLRKGKQAFDISHRMYQDVIDKGPKTPHYANALWEIGNVHRDRGLFKEAREDFERYLNTYPQDDGRRREYAWYLFSLRKFSEAMAECAKMKNQFDGRWQVAEMYRQRKMLEDCIGVLQALVVKYKTRAADVYWQMAWVYRTVGKWKEATETYQILIAKFPEKSDASYWELGRMHHYNMGKYKEAIQFYDMSNKEPNSLFEKADCYRRMKDYEKGIKTLAEIIGFFEVQAPEAQLRIAQYFEQWGKPDLAVRAYKAVCDKYPRSHQSQRAHDTLEMKYKIPYTGGGVKKNKEKDN